MCLTIRVTLRFLHLKRLFIIVLLKTFVWHLSWIVRPLRNYYRFGRTHDLIYCGLLEDHRQKVVLENIATWKDLLCIIYSFVVVDSYWKALNSWRSIQIHWFWRVGGLSFRSTFLFVKELRSDRAKAWPVQWLGYRKYTYRNRQIS